MRVSARLANLCDSELPEGILTDLIVDGIIAGVGGVSGFSAADFVAFFVYFDFGRYRIYGAGGVFA